MKRQTIPDGDTAANDLDAVLEAMAEGYIALDADGRVHRVNAAAEVLLGQPRQALMSQRLLAGEGPLAGPHLQQACRRARQTGDVVRLEERLYTGDAGNQRWIELRIHPRPDGVALFFTETTRHREECERLLRELAAERSRMRAVLEQMPGGLTLAEAATGEIVVFNNEAERILGHGQISAARPDDWAAYGAIHEDGRRYRADEYPLYQALQGETVRGRLMRYRRGDGSDVMLRANAAPIYDGEGQVAAGICTFSDVTSTLQSDLRLQDMARFPDENPSPVIRIDEAGRILYVNPICRLILKSLELMEGSAAPQIMREAVAECLASDMVRELELSVGDRVFSFLMAPVPERGYANLYGRDMTEWRRAQHELRQSEARFREVLVQSPYPLMVFTDDGMVQLVSRTWTQLTGYTPEELRHVRDWTSRAYLGWGEEVDAAIEQVFDEQVPRRLGEYIIRTREGQERVWDFTDVPLGRLPDGRRLMVSTAVDVTDRKAAEDAAEDARVAAEEARSIAETANAAKDKFLAMLSHELRTPLTPVVMTLGMLAGRDDLPEEVRRDMAMMRRNLDLEARLIDDLLDLSRILNGKMDLQPQVLSLHELCGQVAEVMRPEVEGKQLRFEQKLAAGNDRLFADAARLHQVLSNLLRNAVKFTPAGGRITLTTGAQAGRLLVEVIDEGRGIEPADLQRLFEPFFQSAHATRERLGGLGLGLAIARAIIELHGGQIHAESGGAGRGAKFCIDLPLAQEQAQAQPLTINTPELNLEHQAARVLLVEDHGDTLLLMQRLLTTGGFDVLAADTVRRALDLAAEAHAAGRPVELLVSDFDLPDGNGCELIRRLKRQDPALVGLVLSGYGTEADVRRCLDAGFAAHLTKPVDIRQVRQTLAHLATQRRAAAVRASAT